jgi:hypothetical protein
MSGSRKYSESMLDTPEIRQTTEQRLVVIQVIVPRAEIGKVRVAIGRGSASSKAVVVRRETAVCIGLLRPPLRRVRRLPRLT